MKRIRIIAVIAAIFTALAVYLYLADIKKPETVKRVPVVVAAKEILEGQVITDDMVAIKQIPEEAVVSKAAYSLDAVIGTFSSTYVSPGEQILSTMVFKAEQTNNGLAYAVGKGMRAVTVPVDQVTGVAGFLKPEDHVDVMAVLDIKAVLSPEEFNKMLADKNSGEKEEPEGTSPPSSGSGQSKELKMLFSMVILQDIKVLATGQVMKRDGNDSAPTVVETVTLEVTPEQALRLNLALNEGNVRLMMRSPGDTTLPEMEGVSVANLIDSNDIRILTLLGELAPTASPKPSATPEPSATVEPTATAKAKASPKPTAKPAK